MWIRRQTMQPKTAPKVALPRHGWRRSVGRGVVLVEVFSMLRSSSRSCARPVQLMHTPPHAPLSPLSPPPPLGVLLPSPHDGDQRSPLIPPVIPWYMRCLSWSHNLFVAFVASEAGPFNIDNIVSRCDASFTSAMDICLVFVPRERVFLGCVDFPAGDNITPAAYKRGLSRCLWRG